MSLSLEKERIWKWNRESMRSTVFEVSMYTIFVYIIDFNSFSTELVLEVTEEQARVLGEIAKVDVASA